MSISALLYAQSLPIPQRRTETIDGILLQEDYKCLNALENHITPDLAGYIVAELSS